MSKGWDSNMLKKLKALEAEFPMLITNSSPTQRVGGVAKSDLDKVEHLVPMQSLNDVFSFEEVEDFVNKITEEYGKNIEFDQSPMLINDRTMVPLRAIFEALSATVEWDEQTQVIKSMRNNTLVRLAIAIGLHFPTKYLIQHKINVK